MNGKKWLKVFVLLSFLSVGFVGATNYIVDPFQQYRVKTFYPIAFNKERYKNAGFAKNFNYDSIILGTSMTENFILDETKKLGFNSTLKLSLSGGSAKEQSITLSTAIENNKKLKNVMWGLDNFIFIGEVDGLRSGNGSFPFHLYDRDVINDYKYLISLDTLLDSARAIINPYRHKNKNPILYEYNKMYQWQHNVEDSFTLKHVYKSWENRKQYTNYKKNEQSFKSLKDSFDKNFKSIIARNESIKFYIFLPPYSILYFKHLEIENQLDDLYNFKKYLFKIITQYNNIEVYDFSIAKDITYNLNNYKDMIHYHQEINSWMIDNISSSKQYLVTQDNYNSILNTWVKNVKQYKLPKDLNLK